MLKLQSIAMLELSLHSAVHVRVFPLLINWREVVVTEARAKIRRDRGPLARGHWPVTPGL